MNGISLCRASRLPTTKLCARPMGGMRFTVGGRGGPHVGVPGGLLEAAEAPGAGPHPLQVVTPALEGVQGGHDVLDNVVLLGDLPLDLLPLNLPVLIVDGAKQPDK